MKQPTQPVVPARVSGEPLSGSSSTHFWIPIGAGLFLVALAISALVVPQLRLLHLLQAFIYIAVIILARRNSVWGLGAGVAIAAAWNSLNLFVTHLVQAGSVAFWSFLETGQLRRVDTIMVTLGCVAHFILIAACLKALFQRAPGNIRWGHFFGGGVLALLYLAGIVAIARPR